MGNQSVTAIRNSFLKYKNPAIAPIINNPIPKYNCQFTTSAPGDNWTFPDEKLDNRKYMPMRNPKIAINTEIREVKSLPLC